MVTNQRGYVKLPELDAAVEELQMEPLEVEPAAAGSSASDAVQQDHSDAFNPPSDTYEQPLEPTENSQVSESSSAGPSVPQSTDGVFANIAIDKSTDTPPKYEDDRLPTYGEVFNGEVQPGVFGSVVITPTVSDGLVDGMPVGNGMTFLLTMLVSWLFGVVGFLCAYLMSASHAGRCGARAGIGLQLIHWGIYMQSYLSQYDWYEENGSSSYTLDSYPMPKWLSYVFMLAGWFLFVRACTSFFHARHSLHLRLTNTIDEQPPN